MTQQTGASAKPGVSLTQPERLSCYNLAPVQTLGTSLDMIYELETYVASNVLLPGKDF